MRTFLYIHGRGGNAHEAEHFREFFPCCDVVGVDYRGNTPWDVKHELLQAYSEYDAVGIIANSIGAYFAMNAFQGVKVERAFFISPIVDMEKLIADMMRYSGVTENELAERKEIALPSGEILSWEYLCYVRDNQLTWNVPTHILYGENDSLTPYEVISSFAGKHNATLTVMQDGEHWFHTDEQMRFLDSWLKQYA